MAVAYQQGVGAKERRKRPWAVWLICCYGLFNYVQLVGGLALVILVSSARHRGGSMIAPGSSREMPGTMLVLSTVGAIGYALLFMLRRVSLAFLAVSFIATAIVGSPQLATLRLSDGLAGVVLMGYVYQFAVWIAVLSYVVWLIRKRVLV